MVSGDSILCAGCDGGLAYLQAVSLWASLVVCLFTTEDVLECVDGRIHGDRTERWQRYYFNRTESEWEGGNNYYPREDIGAGDDEWYGCAPC